MRCAETLSPGSVFDRDEGRRSRLYDFNDADSTNQEDVISLFDSTIARLS